MVHLKKNNVIENRFFLKSIYSSYYTFKIVLFIFLLILKGFVTGLYTQHWGPKALWLHINELWPVQLSNDSYPDSIKIIIKRKYLLWHFGCAVENTANNASAWMHTSKNPFLNNPCELTPGLQIEVQSAVLLDKRNASCWTVQHKAWVPGIPSTLLLQWISIWVTAFFLNYTCVMFYLQL